MSDFVVIMIETKTPTRIGSAMLCKVEMHMVKTPIKTTTKTL